MAITVNFRGPILFVHDGTKITDVRIPDCRKRTHHYDGQPADAHYAGILVIPADGSGPDYCHLTDKVDLTIREDKAAAYAGVNGSFHGKIALDHLVSADLHNGNDLELGATGSPELLVRIRLIGGKLGAGKLTADPVQVPYRLGTATAMMRLPLLTTWTGSGTATIKGGAKTIELVDGDEVYIYNWEDDHPSKEDLNAPMDSHVGKPVEPESDFKWLYTLLVPPGGSWDAWINNVGRGSLPAPLSTITTEAVDAKLFYPPNSACDGAIWKEPP